MLVNCTCVYIKSHVTTCIIHVSDETICFLLSYDPCMLTLGVFFNLRQSIMGLLLLEHLVRNSQSSSTLARPTSGYHPPNAILMMSHVVS